MTISLVTSASNNGAAASAATVTYPSTPAAGDLIVFLAANSSAETWTVPTGFTLAATATDTTAGTCCYKVAVGTESGTISSTLGNATNFAAQVAVFHSTVGSWSAPLDKTVTVAPQTLTTALLVGTTAATTATPELLVALAEGAGAAQVPSWSASFTGLLNTSNGTAVGLMTAWKADTGATGTKTTTGTVGTAVASGWCGLLVTFKEPAAAGAVIGPRRIVASKVRPVQARRYTTFIARNAAPGPAVRAVAPITRTTQRPTPQRRRIAPPIVLRAPVVTVTSAPKAAPPIVRARSSRIRGVVNVLRTPLVPPASRPVAPIVSSRSSRRVAGRAQFSRAALGPPFLANPTAIVVGSRSGPQRRARYRAAPVAIIVRPVVQPAAVAAVQPRPLVVTPKASRPSLTARIIGRAPQFGSSARPQVIVGSLARRRPLAPIVLRAPLVSPATKAAPLVVVVPRRAVRAAVAWLTRNPAVPPVVTVGPILPKVIRPVRPGTIGSGRINVTRTPLVPPAARAVQPVVVVRNVRRGTTTAIVRRNATTVLLAVQGAPRPIVSARTLSRGRGTAIVVHGAQPTAGAPRPLVIGGSATRRARRLAAQAPPFVARNAAPGPAVRAIPPLTVARPRFVARVANVLLRRNGPVNTGVTTLDGFGTITESTMGSARTFSTASITEASTTSAADHSTATIKEIR